MPSGAGAPLGMNAELSPRFCPVRLLTSCFLSAPSLFSVPLWLTRASQNGIRMPTPFIEFRGITKTFGGVTALSNVSLPIDAGDVHALMGENGAGKSTLGKTLAGIHRPDAGEIRLAGQSVRIHSPADAAALGIGMVHQELAFCPDLSVAENLALGRYPSSAGLLSRRRMHQRATDLLAQIGIHLDVAEPMRNLSTAQEQMIQIAAALGTGARILVFDEPTSSLSERESQQLFALIERLKSRDSASGGGVGGVTMIYVSHRMPEVFRLCNAISVLRDGRYVGTLRRDPAQSAWPEGTQNQVVQMMIGRAVEDYFPPPAAAAPGPIVLDVHHLSSPGKFSDVSFDLHRGEILGFAGLVGAGRSEIAQALFGLDPHATGTVLLDNQPLPLGSIRTAMNRGLALVPEDRKRQGLVLPMGGRQNLSLPLLDRLSLFGFHRHRLEKKIATDFFARLRVKTASLSAPVSSLSGGNQQKVVLAKWLARQSQILIADEPTRGVDIGAKAAIHQILGDLAAAGVAVILISSELPELLALSARILVMREGQLVGQLPRAQATQDRLLRLMTSLDAAPN